MGKICSCNELGNRLYSWGSNSLSTGTEFRGRASGSHWAPFASPRAVGAGVAPPVPAKWAVRFGPFLEALAGPLARARWTICFLLPWTAGRASADGPGSGSSELGHLAVQIHAGVMQVRQPRAQGWPLQARLRRTGARSLLRLVGGSDAWASPGPSAARGGLEPAVAGRGLDSRASPGPSEPRRVLGPALAGRGRVAPDKRKPGTGVNRSFDRKRRGNGWGAGGADALAFHWSMSFKATRHICTKWQPPGSWAMRC